MNSIRIDGLQRVLSILVATFAASITPVVEATGGESPDAADPAAKAKIVAEATGGRLTSLRGKVDDPDCGGEVDYQADVVDLNGDGRPEVFTQRMSGCYGMAGVQLDLLIEDASGQWVSQFGFPGMYTVLETRHLGFPDIEIGGPGDCFPIWRWDGKRYAPHKRCGG